MARDGWPKNPVIYEIYPRSFQDTSGTGAGDLRGVTQRLDHVAELGADAIWIAPFYPSPLEDGGYDVVDHCAVDPALGDLDDFDALVDRAHSLGLKVMIDQVLNHTSRQNEWFRKSIAREDGFDDWYIWRDPRPDGTPPNNWISYFGQPAWTWNHRRQQYYCHQFLSCQPNLDLRHPEVHKAHSDQMRFWRDRGVDGFRMDAITSYLHDASFRDNPPASPEVRAGIAGADFSPYSYQDHQYDLVPSEAAAEICERVREWAGPDMYILGEINVGNKSIEVSNAFTREDRLDAVYTIDFADRGFTAPVVADVLDRMEKADCAGRIAMWLSSHDQARHVSRAGDGSPEDAAFLAFACAVLPGPWLIYQGEELGLPQPDLPHAEIRDPFDLLYWPDGPGREGARVPIPWDDAQPNAGFSDAAPWLPMNWNTPSVAAQVSREDSVLAFYRRLLAARREHGWHTGRLASLAVDDEVFILDLKAGDKAYAIRINFGRKPARADCPAGEPLLASAEGWNGGRLPPRFGAIWA